jgi:ribulose-5-phosphate 4-epimerase/fuculose-1-phosphate aldolase
VAAQPLGRIDQALGDEGSFPSVWPDPPPSMTPQQRIAASARILDRAGLALDVAGHITEVRDDGETMWATPYGKWWNELRGSDTLVVDYDGNVVDGKWDVTPAIFLHTEIHKYRPDARVVIHNHPYYSTLLATMRLVPEITDQQACMFDGEVVLHDEYAGGVDSAGSGQELADAIGGASVVLLAHEGSLVMGSTIEEATYKFEMFERTCRLNYDALATGRALRTVPEERRARLKQMLLRYSTRFYWNGAVRTLLAEEPDVLD